jgi:hypothetical protein
VKTFYKNAKFDVVDCCNQNLGEKGEGCPICSVVSKLWNDYAIVNGKKESKETKELKTEILAKINKMVNEEVYFNGIMIDDPKKEYCAINFTRVQGLKILEIVETAIKNGTAKGIHEIVWFYTKSKSDKGKTEYTLQNIDMPELKKIAVGFNQELKVLNARPYEEGGPVDLEESIIRKKTPAQIKAFIMGDDVEEDVESNTSSKVDTSVVIDESESLSLDELDGKTSIDKKEESESIDMDDLDLDGSDSLELDEPETPALRSITPEIIRANLKNIPFLKKLVAFSDKSNFIIDSGDLTKNVKLVFKYVTDKKEIQVPEVEFAGIPF